MPFDVEKFRAAAVQPRTEDVKVPGMAHWFGKKADAEWRVRGLTFEEIARAEVAADKSSTMLALIDSLAGDASVKDKVESIRDALGYGADTPGVVIKRLEMLVTASVDPVITLDIGVKLANVHPVEFKQLTDKVLELTGLGQTVGKPKSSGRGGTSKVA